MPYFHRISSYLVVAALIVACDRGSGGYFGGEVSRSWDPPSVDEVSDVPISEFRDELGRQLAAKPSFATDEQWQHAKRLYRRYQMSPLWLDDDGLIESRAEAMVDALVSATTDAISIDAYPLFELANSLDTLRRSKQPTAGQLASADLLLSVAYVALGEDYLTGQIDPHSVAQSWHISTQEERVDSALAASLRDANLAHAIERMRPQDHDYEMLRRMLADYRKIVAAGGWPSIPAGKALKRGDRDDPDRLRRLRARLRAEGYKADSGDVYDATLAAAVATFQARHAINVDSTLGKETLDALNVPAASRLTQIAANLERYRWLPRALGAKYILVNVPAFRLEGYEGGRKSIEMKVIVGAEYEGRATPVFSDSMKFVIFRPYWEVPESIAQKEYWATGRIPSDFQVTTLEGRPHLRQRPGPRNALGLVKFMFPNDFNIYLHDTPHGALFEKDVRAFSHGCIRLEKPDELAQWVLGWPADRVHDAMQGTDNRRVNLPRNIPVYIVYFTAYMRNGQLWFGNDLYARDDRLAQAMAAGAMPSGDAVRAVAALRLLTD